MQDKLSVISQVISEHTVLRRNLKLAGDTVSDEETLMELAEKVQGWPTEKRNELNDRQQELIRTLATVAAGLKNHFTFEEEKLPVIIGDIMVRALKVEHRELDLKVNAVLTSVSGIKFDELAGAEISVALAQVKRTVNDLSKAVERHAEREMVLIQMAQKALRG